MHVFDLLHLDYDYVDAYTTSEVSASRPLDTPFRKLMRNGTGFFIWRVDNMEIVALPKNLYGTFYDSETYIIYASSPLGTPANTDLMVREVKTSLDVHIHFWLGASTTADKSGVAAYKAMELDEFLGGHTIQHRESQGNESSRFKSYFRNGIRIFKGFANNMPKIEPRMFKIAESRTQILTEQPSIAWNYFNSNDVFLIQLENAIFIWLGRAATTLQKLHSANAASSLKTETSASKIIFIDDGYEQTLSAEEKDAFQAVLPLDKRFVMPSETNEKLNTEPAQLGGPIKLYKCSDISGKYRVTEMKTGPLQQADLLVENVYIIDNAANGIWVWVGKRASGKERAEAMRNARGFVKKKKYPNFTNVTRVIDGNESLEFKMLFRCWKDASNAATNCVAVGKRAIIKFDAITMEERTILSAETQLVDDGMGTLKIWRIMNDNALEISKEKHAHFFSGDCYIIWYNYEASSNRDLVFYWIGSNANSEETKSAAMKINEMDDQLDKTTARFRICEGYEPAQFLQLFKGKLTIYKGAGTDFDVNGRNLKHPTNYLLRVEGSASFSSKAIQVPFKSAALHPNYCFILKRSKHYFIWCGNQSTGDQREMAKHFAGKDFEFVMEGKETKEFWELLESKSHKTASNNQLALPLTTEAPCCRKNVRLFRFSSKLNQFKVEEILNFTQSDLIPEDIMLLDAQHTIFIWIGRMAISGNNMTCCERYANDFLQLDAAGNNVKTAICIIRQHYELPIFTGFFPNWSPTFWKDYKPFETIRQSLHNTQSCQINPPLNNTINDGVFNNFDKYPLNILKEPLDKLPGKVDPLAKELHLTHDDFVLVFQMTFDEFDVLPKWKQQELKKKVGLF